MKINKISKVIATVAAVSVGITMCLSPVAAASKNIKEETVYVITDAKGAVTEAIVSDHLINNTGAKTINDISSLHNITNVKGDEKFTQKGNKLTWDANGNDIYYQGSTGKPMPVTMEVNYFLNGKAITGSQLQGKSGDVKIQIKYHNNARIGSTNVPFVVMSGFIADKSNFDKISIDNGKIVDNGERNIVVAMAAPGLKESLNIDSKTIKLGDTVTITGKAKSFNCENIMTVVTSNIFEDIDSDNLGQVNFDDKINKLDNGGKALVSGSKKLYDGINLMSSKSDTLREGVSQLTAGANSLNQGSKQLLDGVKNLATGAANLKVGVENAKEGTDSLVAGITKTKEGTNRLYEDSKNFAGGIKGLKEAIGSLAGEFADASSNITSAKGHIDQAMEQLAKSKEALGEETYNALVSQLKAADQSLNNAKAASESGATKAKAVSESADSLANGAGSLSEGIGQVDGSLGQIKTGAVNLGTGMGSLLSGASQINTGAATIQKTGAEPLNAGAASLAMGMNQLSESTVLLIDGVNKLDDGSKALCEGTAKYYNQGIKQLVSLYNNDLKGLLNNLDTIVDAGKEYKIFTDSDSQMDSRVSFIIKTDITK